MCASPYRFYATENVGSSLHFGPENSSFLPGMGPEHPPILPFGPENSSFLPGVGPEHPLILPFGPENSCLLSGVGPEHPLPHL